MRKIAFWRTVGAAYKFVFTNPVTMLRLVWPALVPVAAFSAIHFYRPAPLSLLAALGVGYALSIVITVTICVAMVRAILLRETSWTASLTFRWTQWRIFGAAVVIFLPMWLAAYVTFQIFAAFAIDRLRAGDSSVAVLAVASIIPPAIQMALWSVMGRLTLALPAIAMGEGGGVFGLAWTRSRGNAGRMLMGSSLCWLPFQILQYLGERALRIAKLGGKTVALSDQVSVYVPVSELLFLVVGAVTGILGVSLVLAFCTYSYAQLAQPDLAQTLAASRAARDRAPTPLTDIKSAT